MIAAGVADLPEILEFLWARAETAMFLLNILHHYGKVGDHRYSPQIWMQRDRQGEISDVMALNQLGEMRPCFTTDAAEPAAQALRGKYVQSIEGPKAAVRGIEAAAGLEDRGPYKMNQDLPHFLLDLENMLMPEGIGTLIPLEQAPPAIVKEWIYDYEMAVCLTPQADATQEASKKYEKYLSLGSYRVLMDKGRPLSMTGFNVEFEDIVQVAGVYTPPELRGQGFARRALALHLEKAAENGVKRATLCALSDTAARAYKSIGFQNIGTWTHLGFSSSRQVLESCH